MTKKKIIAVDDQPENLKMLLAILKDDYSIIVATNGAKALELAAEPPYASAILLDVSMPEMDGFEVLEVLKANPEIAHIPVLFVSGHTDEAHYQKGLALGAYDFVSKPISPAILKHRLNHCIA